jgi:hypothetical protein
MIVDYFDIIRVTLSRFEVNSPPFIDANAVLTLPIASQHLETVAWGHA